MAYYSTNIWATQSWCCCRSTPPTSPAKNHNPFQDMHSQCYECNHNSPVVLPFEMLEAVHQGNVPMIKDYIAKDYDVNASYEWDSLLGRACTEGHAEIVELLLQCPEIHLNRQNQGKTPLMFACQNGHTECMKLLINSACKCELNFDNCWRALANLLTTQPELKLRSAMRILSWAGFKRQWDVVKLILQTKHHFTVDDVKPFITNAADQDRWDVIREVFKREFIFKNELVHELLPIVVRMRCWDRVKEVLCMSSAELKLDIPLVEAALAGRADDLQKLSSKGNFDSPTLNGCLLVAAAGGTTEPVAKFLLSFEKTYTKQTFSDALFMAATGNSVAMFPFLLSSREAVYSFDDLFKIHKQLRDPLMSEYFKKFISEHQDKSSGGIVL